MPVFAAAEQECCGQCCDEVAPGIDVERDILALMNCTAVIPRDPSAMDARIFCAAAIDLRDDMLVIRIGQR